VLDAAPALPRTGDPFTYGIALVRLGMKADLSRARDSSSPRRHPQVGSLLWRIFPQG